MNESITIKPPTWFWVVSVLALLWNLMGVGAYLAEAFMTEEVLSAMSEADRGILEARPAWVTAAFAIAVFSGLLGCIGLLLRKKWAYILLLLSLLGVLAQNTYYFFMSNATEGLSSTDLVMTILVIVISIFLVFFAKAVAKKQWYS